MKAKLSNAVGNFLIGTFSATPLFLLIFILIMIAHGCTSKQDSSAAAQGAYVHDAVLIGYWTPDSPSTSKPPATNFPLTFSGNDFTIGTFNPSCWGCNSGVLRRIYCSSGQLGDEYAYTVSGNQLSIAYREWDIEHRYSHLNKAAIYHKK